MNKIVEELKKVGVFHIATVDKNGVPHVRPFGAVCEFDGKAYICTNNTKACYDEMVSNPKTEISAMYPNGDWLRLSGELVRDNRDEARAAMLEANEGLKNMYHVGDGVFEVLYLKNAKCIKYSFTQAPVVIE